MFHDQETVSDLEQLLALSYAMCVLQYVSESIPKMEGMHYIGKHPFFV